MVQSIEPQVADTKKEIVMRGLYMFIAGILVAVATQFAIAQSQNEGVVRMNHVGISSPNIEEAIELSLIHI